MAKEDLLKWVAEQAAPGMPPVSTEDIRKIGNIIYKWASSYRDTKDAAKRETVKATLLDLAIQYHVCRTRQLNAAGADLDDWRNKKSPAEYPEGSMARLIAYVNAYAAARADVFRGIMPAQHEKDAEAELLAAAAGLKPRRAKKTPARSGETNAPGSQVA